MVTGISGNRAQQLAAREANKRALNQPVLFSSAEGRMTSPRDDYIRRAEIARQALLESSHGFRPGTFPEPGGGRQTAAFGGGPAQAPVMSIGQAMPTEAIKAPPPVTTFTGDGFIIDSPNIPMPNQPGDIFGEIGSDQFAALLMTMVQTILQELQATGFMGMPSIPGQQVQ